MSLKSAVATIDIPDSTQIADETKDLTIVRKELEEITKDMFSELAKRSNIKQNLYHYDVHNDYDRWEDIKDFYLEVIRTFCEPERDCHIAEEIYEADSALISKMYERESHGKKIIKLKIEGDQVFERKLQDGDATNEEVWDFIEVKEQERIVIRAAKSLAEKYTLPIDKSILFMNNIIERNKRTQLAHINDLYETNYQPKI